MATINLHKFHLESVLPYLCGFSEVVQRDELGYLGHVLECLWGYLGKLEAILRVLGAILKGSWGLLGSYLGGSRDSWKLSWKVLEVILGVLGAILKVLGAILSQVGRQNLQKFVSCVDVARFVRASLGQHAWQKLQKLASRVDVARVLQARLGQVGRRNLERFVLCDDLARFGP